MAIIETYPIQNSESHAYFYLSLYAASNMTPPSFSYAWLLWVIQNKKATHLHRMLDGADVIHIWADNTP